MGTPNPANKKPFGSTLPPDLLDNLPLPEVVLTSKKTFCKQEGNSNSIQTVLPSSRGNILVALTTIIHFTSFSLNLLFIWYRYLVLYLFMQTT